MSGFDDFINSTPLGGFFYNPASDKANAQQGLSNAQGAYSNLTPPSFTPVNYQGPQAAAPAEAGQAANSGLNSYQSNPEAMQTQQAQIAALQNLQANGGRNAASDANLAAIQQQENQNAAGQRDAAMQALAARGQSGSGNSLLAALDSGQNAVNRQSAEDMGVAGQEAQTALQAGQGAAAIGSNMENQQFGEAAQEAAAQNAINQFNAGQTTQANLANMQNRQNVNNATAAANNAGQTMNNYEMPQSTYGDQLAQAGGTASTNLAGTNYYQNQQKMNMAQQGGLWGGAAQLGASALGSGGLASMFGGGAGGASATGLAGAGGVAGGGAAGEAIAGGDEVMPYAGDAAAAADDVGGDAMASTGGKIPGIAAVPGDSPFNDFMKTMTSPGEVVVPRTLAMGGTKSQIGNFVQHAPTVKATSPDKNKEAMLSALGNIRRRAA